MCYLKLFQVFQQLDEYLLGGIFGLLGFFQVFEAYTVYKMGIPLKKGGKSLVLVTLCVAGHQFLVSYFSVVLGCQTYSMCSLMRIKIID